MYNISQFLICFFAQKLSFSLRPFDGPADRATGRPGRGRPAGWAGPAAPGPGPACVCLK